MTAGNYRFRFRLVPSILLLLLAPLFVSLGFWQLERAEFKREQAATIDERGAMPVTELVGTEIDAEAWQYRDVRVQGVFEAGGEFYLENRRRGGRTGFHVVTPLQLSDQDTRVLVNRGWVEARADGDAPDLQVPGGVVTVRGQVYLPSPPALVLHSGPEAAREWGRRWPYMTVDLYQATVDHPLMPFVLLQHPDDEHGYVREWPREKPTDGMHIGYAIQWFAFALFVLIIYLRLALGGARTKDATS